MISIRKILVTTGDRDGIGFEVTAKALLSLGPQKGSLFVVFRDPRQKDPLSLRLMNSLAHKFQLLTFANLQQALAAKKMGPRSLFVIESLHSPALWVEESAKACLAGSADAIATAPLSKPEIKRAGLKDIGHTDILKRVAKKKIAYMAFVGNKFNVVLATGHIPIQKVAGLLNSKALENAICSAQLIQKLLPTKSTRKPLAVLGLNPHSGDQGLIGNFEDRVLTPTLKRLRRRKLRVVGPLVPDVAFKKGNWSQFSAYVCLYHDQGLIPFKMIHGLDNGVHITLGLPIRRTSVDHGTAKDIFGKNKANPKSMKEALIWAIKLARSSHV